MSAACIGLPVKNDFIFFLEYEGELRIIVLIVEKRSHTETQTHTPPLID